MTSMRSVGTGSRLIVQFPVDQNPSSGHVNVENEVGHKRDQAGCIGSGGHLKQGVSAMVIHTNDLTEHLLMRIHDDATNEIDPIERVVAGGRKCRSRKGHDTAPNLVRLSSIRKTHMARYDTIRMYSGTLDPK